MWSMSARYGMPQTAKVAMQAANSGRYVLSTLHARSVASTVAGLLSMGLAPHTLAANLTGVVNVRLVRRLCTACRRPEPPSEAFLQLCDEAGVPRPGRALPAGRLPRLPKHRVSRTHRSL